MFKYHKPPPVPTIEEYYEKGKTIGLFDIDILPGEKNLKTYTYWRGFRKSDFEKFTNHPVLEILKKIYSALEPNQITKKPQSKGFFEDNSVMDNIQSKKDYPKGTKFVAYLQLDIILRPYDFEKGELFFECREYDFPDGIPKLLMDRELYDLLVNLHSTGSGKFW